MLSKAEYGDIFMRRFIFLILISLCLCSCDIIFSIDIEPPKTNVPNDSGTNTPAGKTDNIPKPSEKNVINCPAEIAAKVFEYARKYEKADTVYKMGGQDSLRAIAVDCSGLVVMCYRYALEGSGYSLLLSDMSSSYMCNNASTHIDFTQLRQGDLIFMGDKGESKTVNHVAIFDCIKDGRIYFIDATDKSGLNGVGRRSYPKNDSHFKYFGVMKLKARQFEANKNIILWIFLISNDSIINMENTENTLADLRLQIDAADDKVLAALAERMNVAKKIGELKKESGGAVMDADREAQKLVALQDKADKILKPYVSRIYSVLFEVSRDLQSKLQIASLRSQ